MRLPIAVWLVICYVASGIVATALTISFFEGAPTINDSFLNNIITVDGFVITVLIVALPVGVRKLGIVTSIREYVDFLRGIIKKELRKQDYPDLSVVFARILSNSLTASTLLIPVGTVCAYAVSIILSLYSISHNFSLTATALAFALLVAGFVQTAGIGLGLLFIEVANPPTSTPPIASTPEVHETSSVGSAIATELREQNARALRAQRLERYRKLNENVFIPLRDYLGPAIRYSLNQDPWNQLRLDYDLTNIRQNPFFDEGVKHLQKDIPSLPQAVDDIELKAQLLSDEVRSFRENIAKFQTTQALDVVTEDDPTVEISETYRNLPNQILLPNIFDILSARWISPVIFQQSVGQTLDSSLVNQIASTNPQFSSTIEGENVMIEGTRIASLSNEGLRRNLVTCVNQLQRNLIVIQGIVDFAKRRQELTNRIATEVRIPLQGLISSITAERYQTECEFCPM